MPSVLSKRSAASAPVKTKGRRAPQDTFSEPDNYRHRYSRSGAGPTDPQSPNRHSSRNAHLEERNEYVAKYLDDLERDAKARQSATYRKSYSSKYTSDETSSTSHTTSTRSSESQKTSSAKSINSQDLRCIVKKACILQGYMDKMIPAPNQEQDNKSVPSSCRTSYKEVSIVKSRSSTASDGNGLGHDEPVNRYRYQKSMDTIAKSRSSTASVGDRMDDEVPVDRHRYQKSLANIEKPSTSKACVGNGLGDDEPVNRYRYQKSMNNIAKSRSSKASVGDRLDDEVPVDRHRYQKSLANIEKPSTSKACVGKGLNDEVPVDRYRYEKSINNIAKSRSSKASVGDRLGDEVPVDRYRYQKSLANIEKPSTPKACVGNGVDADRVGIPKNWVTCSHCNGTKFVPKKELEKPDTAQSVPKPGNKKQTSPSMKITVNDMIDTKVLNPIFKKMQRMSLQKLENQMMLVEQLERFPDMVHEVYQSNAYQK